MLGILYIKMSLSWKGQGKVQGERFKCKGRRGPKGPRGGGPSGAGGRGGGPRGGGAGHVGSRRHL